MSTFVRLGERYTIAFVESLDEDLQAAADAAWLEDWQDPKHWPSNKDEVVEWLAAYDPNSWELWAEIERTRKLQSGDYTIIAFAGFRFADKATALLFKLTFGGA